MPPLDPYDDARDRQRARHGGAAPDPYWPEFRPDQDGRADLDRRPGREPGREPIVPVYAPPGTDAGATAEFVMDRPLGGPPPVVVPGRPNETGPARPPETGPARPHESMPGTPDETGPGENGRNGTPGGDLPLPGPGRDDPDGEETRRRGPGRRRATRSGAPAPSNAARQAEFEATTTGALTTGGAAATTGPPKSRAGRNLPAAIGVGLGLGALIIGSLAFRREGFLLVVAAAVVVGVWEMVRALNSAGARPPLVPLVGGGVLMVGLAWFAGPDALSLGLLLTLLATTVWRLGDGVSGFLRDISAGALIAVYVPFLGGFAALLTYPEDGVARVCAAILAVVLTDTGGYAAGVFLGRHPMAPTISPKKSWEGLGGSVLASAAGSALFLWIMLDVAPWWGAVFGIGVTISAVLGDLAESMIKRDLKIKDMSNLLPGHGGLMDRLDSILFALPTAYLLLAVIVPGN